MRTTAGARPPWGLLARGAGAAAVLILLSVTVGARQSGVGEAPAVAWPLLWERELAVADKAYQTVVVADLDGDGAGEPVVVARQRGAPSQVTVLDGRDGGVRWARAWSGRVECAAADIEAGGGSELVVAWLDSLQVLSGADGSVLRSLALKAPVGEIVFGLVDGDERPDLIYTAGHDYDDLLVAVSGASWRDLWVRRTEPDRGILGGGFEKVTPLDLDGDGRDEVLAVERRNTLVCLEPTGATLWTTVLGKKTRYLPEGVASSRPVAADLAARGANDVAVGCFAGALVVLDAAGGEQVARMQFGLDTHARYARDPRLPRFLRGIVAGSGEPITEILVTEIDGRPGADLVFGSCDGFVYAVAPRRAEILWRFDSISDVYGRCIALPADEPLLVAWDAKATYVLRAADGALAGRLPLEGGVRCAAEGDVNGDGILDVVAVAAGGSVARAWSTGIAAGRP
ncbi:MAG: hypothetical protein FJY74_09455 [Candidatus Eisenbacteria bacterium]|nr:hypothetical protein [Candidatus Eisenbacteria bacterium]